MTDFLTLTDLIAGDWFAYPRELPDIAQRLGLFRADVSGDNRPDVRVQEFPPVGTPTYLTEADAIALERELRARGCTARRVYADRVGWAIVWARPNPPTATTESP